MTLINILAMAVALAMDAFAVSVATGVTLKKISGHQIFRLAWHFGFFQFLMPVIGWWLGLSVRLLIENYDHWVAFLLLSFVGGKMIKEAFEDHQEETTTKDPTKGMTLIMLSIATSIDALAVGLSMAMLGISILKPALIIGVVAAFFTFSGMILGSKIGSVSNISRYAEMLGGIVLIAIGLNILHEHGILFS